jgi:hypothetical protein
MDQGTTTTSPLVANSESIHPSKLIIQQQYVEIPHSITAPPGEIYTNTVSPRSDQIAELLINS